MSRKERWGRCRGLMSEREGRVRGGDRCPGLMSGEGTPYLFHVMYLPPPPTPVDRQTAMKTLPSRNFVSGR